MPKPLKLLIVEDSPTDLELVLLELARAGFAPTWQRVDTERAYLQHLDPALDLILSDFQMPQFNGLLALELLKQRGLDVPFILVSGTIGEESAVAAIKQGAADYLMKDRLGRLGPAVTHALEESRRRRERLETDAAAQLQRAELRVLFDLMPARIWFKDAQDRILRVNERAARAAGRTVAEIEGQLASAIYPEESAQFYADDLRVIGSGLPRLGRVETRRDHAGRQTWTQTDRMPVLDLAGQVCGIVVMVRDITEQMRAEQSLQLLNSAVLHSKEPILITEALLALPGPRILFVNPAFTAMTGYTAEEALGKTPRILQGPLTDQAVLRRLRENLAKGEDFEGETINYRKDGTTFNLEWRITPIRGGNGTVTHFVASQRDVTERRRAEAALAKLSEHARKRERILNSALSSMSDFAQIYDRDGRIVFVNQPLLNLWGLPLEAVVGKNFSDLQYPTAMAAKLQGQLEEVFLTGQSLTDEMAYSSPTGLKSFYEYIFSPVFSADGGVEFIVGSTRDVSERRRTEESLRTGAANLAIAQRIAHLGSWEMDLANPGEIDANALRWSDEMFRIAGFEPGAVAVSNAFFFSLVPAEEQAAIRQAVATAMREHRTYTIVHRMVRPDGTVRIVRETAQIFFDEKTDLPLRIVGTAHDITESRQAEDARQQLARRFKALFEQAAVGVAQADANTGRFVQVNQRFCEITGRSAAELEQLTFAAITHPLDIAFDVEAGRQIRSGEIRESTREKRYLRKDGSEIWINLTVSAMWARGETPDYIIAVAQDITERKGLEEQIRQSQKMDAIGTLAGGIAHDFNNILAAITGYTELARMRLEGNPEVQRSLDSVLQATGRATDLVRQILTFSRQQPQERRPVQLLPVIAETFNLLRATIPSTIVFDLALATDAPTVLADPTQVHQILMNLGTNAWHAMKDRPGRLKVTLEKFVLETALPLSTRQLPPGTYARISVRDTGRGMEPETVRRIFEPFFTTKGAGEGTGLGLSVVHGIIDSHEGAITVESRLGEGTVFQVYLPAYAGAATEAEKAPEPMCRGQGQRILVIDDEELLAELGQQALDMLGYEAQFVTEPAAALALVRADPERFALVITDQTMPGMTGLSLARQLRQLRPGLPALLMTGYAAPLTSEQTEEAGICQVLLKPVSMQTLGAAVQAALQGTRAPAAA